MNLKTGKEEFSRQMQHHGYFFDDDGVYKCVDGTIELHDDHIICYNKVIYSDYKSCIMLNYPEDYEPKTVYYNYAQDFKYHLSYSAYKDFMNIDTPNYEEIFTTNILHYYLTFNGDENEN